MAEQEARPEIISLITLVEAAADYLRGDKAAAPGPRCSLKEVRRQKSFTTACTEHVSDTLSET